MLPICKKLAHCYEVYMYAKLISLMFRIQCLRVIDAKKYNCTQNLKKNGFQGFHNHQQTNILIYYCIS